MGNSHQVTMIAPIHIFTPLKNGTALMPEVLQGIYTQSIPCILFPISSDGTSDHSEENKRINMLKALELNVKPYFLLMDSDVVLGYPNIIEELFDNERNMHCDIRTLAAKDEDFSKKPIAHSVTLFLGNKPKLLKEFLTTLVLKNEKTHCPICDFLKRHQTITLKNSLITEISRVDLTQGGKTVKGMYSIEETTRTLTEPIK